MSDDIARLADGTLSFLPERLNRDPAVLRGLTNDEMWVSLGAGAVIGLVFGVPLAIVTASIAMAPTGMIVGMAIILLLSGTLLRRAKRARPETWLYRNLQWQFAIRWHIGRGALVIHSGPWTVRRTRRLRGPRP